MRVCKCVCVCVALQRHSNALQQLLCPKACIQFDCNLKWKWNCSSFSCYCCQLHMCVYACMCVCVRFQQICGPTLRSLSWQWQLIPCAPQGESRAANRSSRSRSRIDSIESIDSSSVSRISNAQIPRRTAIVNLICLSYTAYHSWQNQLVRFVAVLRAQVKSDFTQQQQQLPTNLSIME